MQPMNIRPNGSAMRQAAAWPTVTVPVGDGSAPGLVGNQKALKTGLAFATLGSSTYATLYALTTNFIDFSDSLVCLR
jgi:hypothetical protein